MLDRWGGGPYVFYIYMHCTRSSNKTDLVYQYARHLCSIDGEGGHLPSIYICIVLDLAIKLIWYTSMQGIYAQ